MPKSANQKQKLLILERIFREETDEEHGLSISQLEERLTRMGIACERKSLYSDLETLRQVGLDIVSDRRARNTVYFLGEREFEEPELHLLASAVASSKFISNRKSVSLINKLARLAGKYQGSRLVRQMIVSDRVKSTNESIYYNISYVNEAICGKKQISFLYYNYDSRKKKVYHNDKEPLKVTPRALVWKDENYYVVGWYEKYGKYVNFRADKMERVTVLDEPAFKDADFDIGRHCGRLFGMYGGHGERVTLRFDNSLAGVAVDRFGTGTTFLVSDENSFELKAELDVSPVFFGWLFQFGDKAEIVSPEEVRREFKRYALDTLKQYRK